MKFRGQSGLEYLMTYGWALVVIVIAVGALVVLIDPATLQGEGCSTQLGSGFSVSTESVVNANQLLLVLTNKGGVEATDMDFSLSGETTGTLANQTLAAGATGTYTIPFDTNASGQYTLNVALTYDTPNVADRTATAACRGNI